LSVNCPHRIQQAILWEIWTIQDATMDQKWHEIRKTSCFMITAPTVCARHKPLRLLVLWNVE
jgi:hypothetical protein